MDQEAASAAVREGVQLAVGFRARISACRYQALIGLGQTTGWAGGHDSLLEDPPCRGHPLHDMDTEWAALLAASAAYAVIAVR